MIGNKHPDKNRLDCEKRSTEWSAVKYIFVVMLMLIKLFVRITFFGILLTAGGCYHKREINQNLSSQMPAKFLWAWERPEDLRFLDPQKFGAAFLAQTLTLENDQVIFTPRRQPLEVSPETYLIAVTRIETQKETDKRPKLSDGQIGKLVELIKNSASRLNVKAVQIDFDAVVSERKFYGELMRKLKPNLAENMPLTMTGLASWCIGDAWFNDFPVDEAVPMAFEMGADDPRVRSFLSSGKDWNEPLCRGSYGLSVNDPIKFEPKPNRRIFYFKSSAWTKSDVENL